MRLGKLYAIKVIPKLILYCIFKNFIGNEQRRRKTDHDPKKQPPSKLSRPNGYNLYVGEYFKSEGNLCNWYMYALMEFNG